MQHFWEVAVWGKKNFIASQLLSLWNAAWSCLKQQMKQPGFVCDGWCVLMISCFVLPSGLIAWRWLTKAKLDGWLAGKLWCTESRSWVHLVFGAGVLKSLCNLHFTSKVKNNLSKILWVNYCNFQSSVQSQFFSSILWAFLRVFVRSFSVMFNRAWLEVESQSVQHRCGTIFWQEVIAFGGHHGVFGGVSLLFWKTKIACLNFLDGSLHDIGNASGQFPDWIEFVFVELGFAFMEHLRSWNVFEQGFHSFADFEMINTWEFKLSEWI